MKSQNFCDTRQIEERPESYEILQHLFVYKGKSIFVSYLVEEGIITKH